MSDYLIHLRRTPSCRIPGVIALRRLLKVLGRVYGLKAIDVREQAADAPALQPSPRRPVVAKETTQ